MSIASYPLRGPIQKGDRVILAAIAGPLGSGTSIPPGVTGATGGSFLYFLSQLSTGSGLSIAFDPRNPNAGATANSSSPLVLRVNQTVNGVISFTTDAGGLGIGVNSTNTAVLVATPAPMMFTSPDLSSLPELQAAPRYTFTVNGGNVSWPNLVPNVAAGTNNGVYANAIFTDLFSNPITSFITGGIQVIPLRWYERNGNFCVQSGELSTAILRQQQWAQNMVAGGMNSIPQGFTERGECEDGLFYNYCTVGQTCGSANCKGPCANSAQECDFTGGAFVCRNPPVGGFTRSPWFIVVMVIAGIIFVLIIVVIISLLLRRRRRYGYFLGP